MRLSAGEASRVAERDTRRRWVRGASGLKPDTTHASYAVSSRIHVAHLGDCSYTGDRDHVGHVGMPLSRLPAREHGAEYSDERRDLNTDDPEETPINRIEPAIDGIESHVDPLLQPNDCRFDSG